MDDDDADSAIVESIKSATTSVTSSILAYRTLHGRRYHSEVGQATYWYDKLDPKPPLLISREWLELILTRRWQGV